MFIFMYICYKIECWDDLMIDIYVYVYVSEFDYDCDEVIVCVR